MKSSKPLIFSRGTFATALLIAFFTTLEANATPIADWVGFPTLPVETGDTVDLAAIIVSLDPGYTSLSTIDWSFDGNGATALSPSGSNPFTFQFDTPGDYLVSFVGIGVQSYTYTGWSSYSVPYSYWNGWRWVTGWNYVPYSYTNTVNTPFTVTGTGTIRVNSLAGSSPTGVPDYGNTIWLLGLGLLGLRATKLRIR